MNRVVPLSALVVVLSGCSLAPDFVLPDIMLPKQYREQSAEGELQKPEGQWMPVDSELKIEQGVWWQIFGDKQLDALEAEAMDANQTLRVALTRVDKARAIAEVNTDSILPTISAGGNAVRTKPSNASGAAFGASGTSFKPYTLYGVRATASYEVDLFGKARDNYQAFLFDADAQQAIYQGVLLSLQADVAQHYFSIRALDSERQLLRETVMVREEAARIMKLRYDEGEAEERDWANAQSDLATAQSEMIGLDRARAGHEHALALLLGKMPSDYKIAEMPLVNNPPAIPPGLPSSLLERRPDVAQAVAAMQAANRRIGVARTAFFPSLTLTANGGSSSTHLEDIFKWSGRTWALGQTAGNALVLPIFDSGRNFAGLDAAKSSYEESVASYRQQVLTAFRDVEDSLSEQRLLAEQSQKQGDAMVSAIMALNMTQMRYDEGDVNYSELVNTQRNALAVQRAVLQTRGQRFVTAVTLIRALGGGWGEPSNTMPEEEPSKSVYLQDVAPLTK